jgi:hypothetical protein
MAQVTQDHRERAAREVAGGLMPYVMVPVPEEHVEDVMRLVLRLRAKTVVLAWDDAGVRSFFGGLDEMSRALVSFVARGASAGKDLTDADVAALMQLKGRETNALIREVNALAKESARPGPIITNRVKEPLPNGRTIERRYVTMAPEVAVLFRTAEKEEARASRGAP